MSNFKEIAGFEGRYQISNDGIVQSLPRFNAQGKTLRPAVNKSGYQTVSLWKDNKGKSFYVHQLVARHFLPVTGEVVNHIDGNKTNNSVSNLEWVSSGANNKHALDSGLRNPMNNFIDEQTAVKIDQMFASGKTRKEIAETLGIPKYSVGSYLRGDSYKRLKSLKTVNNP